ncbi:hypothetical protein [Paracidovorax sp. MALMAid1276]|uniref:hypothetical protein n=1 Tax=Paracidovorax sp. MALMAid1276 TaxID=3411631 RepID=UPI003B9B4DF7
MPGWDAKRGPARWRVRLALWWLLSALVLVPALGRLHQLAHGHVIDQTHAGHLPHDASHRAGAGQAQDHAQHHTEAQGGDHAGVPLALLLASHAPADCLVLDQLALADALHATPPALRALAPVQAAPLDGASPRACASAAAFLARGPPVPLSVPAA